MSTLGRRAWKSIVRVESAFDRTAFSIRRRLKLFGPVHIYPYRGFGTPDAIWLHGRVLVDRGLERTTSEDSLWKNFRMSLKRFASDEIAGARVRLRYRDAEEIVVTDDEGYYTSKLEPSGSSGGIGLWQAVDAELLDPIHPEKDRLRAWGEVQIPAQNCSFGVISDVDDTVIRTEATSILTMLRLTLFHNAYSRKPFSGVSAFYRALHVGPDGSSEHPFFYVSSSPWNLYDLLTAVFDIQDLPRGTFFLRDLGLDETKIFKSGHDAHKLAEIERVMAAYPDMQFVLIGDSGQRDPEIYQQVVADFPGRVRAVYIRDVRPELEGKRDLQVKEIAREVSRAGVPMLPVRDTVEAAHHAAEVGLIDPIFIPGIEVDRQRDEGRFEPAGRHSWAANARLIKP